MQAIDARAAALFDGWTGTLIRSCLQGHMGRLCVNDPACPTAALIEVGDFALFAGVPSDALLDASRAPLLVPQNDAWCAQIEARFGDAVVKAQRYAIQTVRAFDVKRLTAFAASLPAGYALRPIDGALYRMAMAASWSQDFCALFCDEADYLARGLGFAVLHEGAMVAGASSYSVFDGGIEIEIDTLPAHRRKGLATACAAQLILTCLARGLYPSWDAHDLRSVALCEKLGYRMDHPYVTYEVQRN